MITFVFITMSLSLIFTSFMVIAAIRQETFTESKFYIERAWYGVYTFALMFIALIVIGIL